MDKIKTHIKKVDEMINQGFPEGSLILLSGDEGTGKTIFSLSFIYKNAINDNKKCLYITFEEKKEDLLKQAEQFSWDLRKLEKEKKIRIISVGIEEINKTFISDLLQIIKKNKVEILVLDSLTTLTYLNTDLVELKNENPESKMKKFIYQFMSQIKEAEITTLLISQRHEEISDLIARYQCDGVFLFTQEAIGEGYTKLFSIRKLRRTEIKENLKPIIINEKGFDLEDI